MSGLSSCLLLLQCHSSFLIYTAPRVVVFLSACVPAEPKQVHPQLLAALQARRITLFNLNVKIFGLGLGVRLIKHTSEDTHQKEGTACF